MKEILAFLALYHCHPAEPVYIPGLQHHAIHNARYKPTKADSEVIVHYLYMQCIKDKYSDWYELERKAYKLQMKWKTVSG